MLRAIVVGGSIGGLLIAAALVEHVDNVIVLDRDEPPAQPSARRGAAQGAQVHALLDSGRAAMHTLLPGLFEQVREHGGVEVDFGVGARWYHSGSYKVHGPIGLMGAAQSRPLLEHLIRQQVSAIANVELRHGVTCTGLEVEHGKVCAVRITNEHDEPESLQADIVILATGRSGHPIHWLEAVGCRAPPTDSVPINIGYASRRYRGFPGVTADTPMLFSYGTRAKTARHGLAFRIENGDVLVTLMGYHGDHPPRDPAAWQAWARTLETPDIADHLEHATPYKDVVSHRAPEQYRRHWQRVNLPEGVAIFGDAACGLDPVFGQGMSVVATQAAALAQMLRQGPFQTKPIQKMVARKADRAWFITSVEAARYSQIAPHVHMPMPMVRFLQWFLDRVYAVSSHDPVVYRAFLDVMVLNRGPAWLMRPRVLWRILGRRSKRQLAGV